MNKFQKERDEIFGTKKLNEEQKRAVIDAVHAPLKRKTQWLTAVVVAGVLGISSFLLFVPNEQQVVEEEPSPIENQYTATTLEQLTEQQLGNMPFKTLKIVEPFVTNNDALIINKVQWEGEGFDDLQYYLLYAEKNNGKWEQQNLFPGFVNDNRWNNVTLHNEDYFYGILTDNEVENVIVGNTEASLWDVDGNTRVWFAKAKSINTPVYYEKNETRSLLSIGWTNLSTTIPFIEGNANEQTLRYTGDTMYRGNKEYTEFPLLIDPYYYGQNPYNSGDVVAIETLNGVEITRIIDTNQNKVTIDESKIIIGENFVSYEFYLAANYNGDTSIYLDERIEFTRTESDEVFVHPDNWGSSGTRGPISKEAIKGKVIGYDLHGVTNTMTQQDLNLFSEVQEMVQKMKWRKYAVNPLNTILKDASAQSVAKLYFYAHYLEDYETMYALINQSQNTPPPYKQWVENMKLVTTKSSKQRLLVNIYEANRMTMNTATKRLEWLDENSGQTISYLPMVKDEGIWKITYETVKRN
ncbi:MAG: hypothetical protein ABS944_04685 [Solibacillus sp.]|uniref:hypothetical protein n=1 Tax=Solibacillus sp. TaxID=1909654 RepID=UPI0033152A9A